ncbi:hypothetical protein [Devosia sp. LjRoot3]|uniref:hypothetical protein n=1 Tax=Devosia sp. LjRoot3 TaxID=3342319 RepID=UPI003ED13B9A
MGDNVDGDDGDMDFEFRGTEWLPWTGSPKPDYLLALGQFLVTFNKIENIVSDLIVLVLTGLDREDRIKDAIKKQLGQRLEVLDWLLLHRPDVPPMPMKQMKELSDQRASLAHGHFEPNPFTGEYKIVGKGERYEWSPDAIAPLTKEAERLFDEFYQVKMHLFYEVVGAVEARKREQQE